MSSTNMPPTAGVTRLRRLFDSDTCAVPFRRVVGSNPGFSTSLKFFSAASKERQKTVRPVGRRVIAKCESKRQDAARNLLAAVQGWVGGLVTVGHKEVEHNDLPATMVFFPGPLSKSPGWNVIISVAEDGARPCPRRRLRMKYILMDYVNEAGWRKLIKAEQENWLGAYMSYLEVTTQAGVLKSGNSLQRTSAATTVRVVNGRTQVLDGPYADTKEQIAGFHIVDVADLDAAISWAARCPTARNLTAHV
jgi:hypothetical protein